MIEDPFWVKALWWFLIYVVLLGTVFLAVGAGAMMR